MTEPTQDMSLEEAQRQLWAAIAAITKAGFMLAPPPEIKFSVVKPDGWRRHVVVATAPGIDVVVERFWSWDRADDLAQKLNGIMRSK